MPKYLYSIPPLGALAGTVNASLISNTASGLPIRHPSTNPFFAGKSFSSPFGQPCLIHPSKVSPRRRIALVADAELVVDPPLVADDAVRVEDKRLRRTLRPELVGDAIPFILQDGKRNLVLRGMLGDFLDRILRIGVDRNER